MDIKEITTRAVNGDQKAFAILYKKYKNVILNKIKMNTMGNQQLSEDITQDAFVKAFNNISKFNPNTNFATWVYRIAKNTLIDHFRLNEQKNHKVSLESSINEDEDNSASLISIIPNLNAESPEYILEKEQRKNQINKIINNLFPQESRYRKILELRFLQELKYEEIAQELQMPLGTVKTDLRTIKDKLSKELKKLNFESIL